MVNPRLVLVGLVAIALAVVVSYRPILNASFAAANMYLYPALSNNDSYIIATIYVPLKNMPLLYYYLYAVSNPYSPLYHHFLSKGEVAELFYPRDEYLRVLNYLKERGFRVLFTAADSIIVVGGDAWMFEKYLGLKFNSYSYGNISYYEAYGRVNVEGVDLLAYSSNLTLYLFNKPTFLITSQYLNSTLGKVAMELNLTFPLEAYGPTILQGAYNATALYRMGFYGQNYTIGILDFMGDPYIVQQLEEFDQEFNLTNPPSFTIVPIGPYNPNLGVWSGWAYEISLDVEVAHALAPRANIVLFVANPALPLAAIIAYIDNYGNVNVVSQSFGFPESILSQVNGPAFYFNVALADLYYALGGVEGITFVAASGDGGGAGYGNGPLGSIVYPSASPYVTAVGGTTVYAQLPNGTYYQTAWSSYGFIPLGQNLGGSTGGVSVVEPKPWYQWFIKTPQTYPFGRMTPDIAADASPYPGLLIIGPAGTTLLTGGTSASAPIIAALLTLVMDYVNSTLGFINPTLYAIAQSPMYGKAIVPITFGYNIPWTAHYGYNLVTGLGTVNVGYLAEAFAQFERQHASQLSIEVHVFNSSGMPQRQYYPGEEILVSASILNSSLIVTSGSFYATIVGVWGNVTTIPLNFQPPMGWVGMVKLPQNATGILYVVVYGRVGNLTGFGFTEIYSGYYARFLWPMPFVPIYPGLKTYILVNLTNIYGEMPQLKKPMNLTATLYYYSFLNNSYVKLGTIVLTPYMFSFNETLWRGVLPNNTFPGDVLVSLNGAYGVLEFTSGTMLQSMFILPQVVAQPGSVAPGQYVTVIGMPIPPLNLYKTSEGTGMPIMYNVYYGSNITAYLMAPNGTVLESSPIYYNPVLGEYYGTIKIPSYVKPGLYEILLNSTYESYTLNATINGVFFGQIYVSGGLVIPHVWASARYVPQGSLVTIYVNITYPNGTEVRYGVFSATVYPANLRGLYPYISSIFETPLWYNPRLGLWMGNFTIPSQFSLGSLSYLLGNLYFSSPYYILVSGVSSDGYTTPVVGGGQYMVYVTPYTLIKDAVLNSSTSYYAVLLNDTLKGGVYIYDSIVNSTITGNVTLVYCNLTNVKFINAHVYALSAQMSNITLVNTTLHTYLGYIYSINILNGSVVRFFETAIDNMHPKPPTIIIYKPSFNESLTGLAYINFSVVGDYVSSVLVYLDDKLLASLSGNGTFTIPLNTTVYPDGTYRLTVIAMQNDGINSTASVDVIFSNEVFSLRSSVGNVWLRIGYILGQLSIFEVLLLAALAMSAAAIAWLAVSQAHKG